MKKVTQFTIAFATLLFMVALLITPAKAADSGDCQIVYGGQVCGSATPEIAETAGSADVLYTLSGTLYGTGLLSFIAAKNADKFVPKI